MGNSFRKIDLQGTIVDGGSLQSKDTASRPSQTTTQRDPNEADPKVVGKLINAKKLAPFYEGQFDEKPDGASNVDRQSRLSSRNSRHDSSHQDAVATSPNSRGKKKPSISSSGGGSKKKSQAPPIVDNKWLTTGLIECPICFLWYPRNINVTKCCRKAMCTQCFVSMKRPARSQQPISCPFCRHTNLIVVYKPPEVIVGRSSKYHRTGIACESIRPPRLPPSTQGVRYGQVYYRYGAVPPGGVQVSPTFAAPSQRGQYYQSHRRPGVVYYVPAHSSRDNTAGRTLQYPPRITMIDDTGRMGGTRVPAAPAPSITSERAQRLQEYEERIFRRALQLSVNEY